MLETAAQEISASTGNVVLPLQCDIRDPAAIQQAVDLCVEKLGLPDVCVHNAAGNFISPTERLSPNAFREGRSTPEVWGGIQRRALGFQICIFM